MAVEYQILWVDDEIELLKPHILFLKEKGYSVTPVNNGLDAIELVKSESFDLILLDEQMAGMDGLTALQEFKEIAPSLPVVMVTKSEEESMMEQAIGARIDDYLTKPVNPSQILLICKKILDSKQIVSEKVSRDYTADFAAITARLMQAAHWSDWLDVATRLARWDVELDKHPDSGLQQTLSDQRREGNAGFGKFIERNYVDWLQGHDSPPLSTDVVSRFVLPHLQAGKRTVLVVVDNLRLDQWLVIEPALYDYFEIKRDYHFSILPTATPYSRNAIFAGLFPDEIEDKHPDLWQMGNDDESSLNKYERELLAFQLQRLNVRLKPDFKYVKILDANEARQTERQIATLAELPLVALVINFVDILAHGRSDSRILREIIPDEAAYRSLTETWFSHSALFKILKELSARGNTVVLTSDHGSIRCMRGAKVLGDRETSTNLRYKYGRNVKSDSKFAIQVKDPREWHLPRGRLNTNYLIAREDYYFVYPTNYHYYLNHYKDTLQHGGVSLEEMILPVVTMQPLEA